MQLAEHLHMTLSQLWEAMTPAEVLLWELYFSVKEEDRLKREAQA